METTMNERTARFMSIANRTKRPQQGQQITCPHSAVFVEIQKGTRHCTAQTRKTHRPSRQRFDSCWPRGPCILVRARSIVHGRVYQKVRRIGVRATRNALNVGCDVHGVSGRKTADGVRLTKHAQNQLSPTRSSQTLPLHRGCHCRRGKFESLQSFGWRVSNENPLGKPDHVKLSQDMTANCDPVVGSDITCGRLATKVPSPSTPNSCDNVSVSANSPVSKANQASAPRKSCKKERNTRRTRHPRSPPR